MSAPEVPKWIWPRYEGMPVPDGTPGDVVELDADGKSYEVGTPAGGGSLPAWWTVDSTPGAESVDFAGEITLSPPQASAQFLAATPADDFAGILLVNATPGDLSGNGYIILCYDAANNHEVWDIDAWGSMLINGPLNGVGGSGGITVSHSNGVGNAFSVTTNPLGNSFFGPLSWLPATKNLGIAAVDTFTLQSSDGPLLTFVDDAGTRQVGFFDAIPVAQPAHPVTLGDVIAALTNLGLVAA